MADVTGWDQLELTGEHSAVLRRAAITPAVAAAAGVCSVTSTGGLPEPFAGYGQAAVPAMLFWWHRLAGDPVPQLRPDTPLNLGDDEGAKYVFPSGVAPVLNVHPAMRERVASADVPLVVVEGTKQYLAAVSALAGAEVAAVGIAGCYGWSSDGAPIADLARVPWQGRTVYLCFDADVTSNRSVHEAAAALSETLALYGAADLRYVRVPGGRNTGLDDALGALPDAAAGMARLLEDATTRLGRKPAAKKTDPAEAVEPRVEERLLEFITSAYTLGQDSDGNGYALPKAGPRIVRMLRGGRPSLEVEAPPAFRQADPAHQVLARHVVKDVLADVEGMCLQARRRPLHLRAAPHREGIVVDLGGDDGRVAVVTGRGWKIGTCVPESFPLFRRSEDLRPLPEPEPGGSLDELRGLLNVTDDTWPLIKGWLIASVFADVPRPWLYHTGPQGSGKTDGAVLVLGVLDPRPGLLPAPRRGDRSDPAAYAMGAYLMGYDNVSKVTGEFSDWLCSLVTGSSESRRVLHTTASTMSMSLMRSGAITGIGISGIRSDLAERLIKVDFTRITAAGRRSRRQLMATFAAAHPRVLGALLDAVAVVLAHRDHIDVAALPVPRMADYASLLAAYDLGTGQDLFGAYQSNVADALGDIADDDPIAQVLSSYIAEHGPINTTPAELYRALTVHKEGTDFPEGAYWPAQPQRLTIALKKMTAAVEDLLRIETGRAGKRRWVTITPVGCDEPPEASSPGDGNHATYRATETGAGSSPSSPRHSTSDEHDEPQGAPSPTSTPLDFPVDQGVSPSGDEGDEPSLSFYDQENKKEKRQRNTKKEGTYISPTTHIQKTGSSPPSPRSPDQPSPARTGGDDLGFPPGFETVARYRFTPSTQATVEEDPQR